MSEINTKQEELEVDEDMRDFAEAVIRQIKIEGLSRRFSKGNGIGYLVTLFGLPVAIILRRSILGSFHCFNVLDWAIVVLAVCQILTPFVLLLIVFFDNFELHVPECVERAYKKIIGKPMIGR